jgi:DNA polymerase-1
MKLLIDADILLYRAAASVENEVEFEDDIWVLWTDENEAIEAFSLSVASLLERADTYGYLLCFSDSKNFRKDILPSYKGQRTQRKPMGFKSIRERLLKEYAHVVVSKPTLEADDCIGILATKFPDDYAIWSADKDLKQIPGKHLTEDGFVDVSPEDADLFFYTQVLTGDTADNYKGCPGVGPVKAEALLRGKKHPQQNPEDISMWARVRTAYEAAGLTEEDALVQARVARILRHEDWDEKKQEVKLWVPTHTA